ncbi:MAG: hypothetical protein H0T63_03465 [Pyrinomonadaceae bacterium]|nr:hypothetical protein [Pyrinomonadaceae bacterium]
MKVQAQPKFFRMSDAAARQQVFLRAVVGSIMLCATLAPIAAGQTATSAELAQGTEGEASFRSMRSERVESSFSQGLKTIRREIVANKPEPSRLDITFNQRGNTNEIINAGDSRWESPVEELVNMLSISGVFEGFPRLSVNLKMDEQRAAANIVATFTSELHATQSAQNIESLLAQARRSSHDEELTVVLNNMTLSANGKRLAMSLEMSRERAGNLLRKHLSLP